MANNGIDALVVSAEEENNAMPPKGICAECSDADLKSTIGYMTTAAR